MRSITNNGNGDKLKKKGFWYRFKRLSRPTGKPQWVLAVRAIILMVIASMIGKFLGLTTGINAIIFVTLFAGRRNHQRPRDRTRGRSESRGVPDARLSTRRNDRAEVGQSAPSGQSEDF